VAGPDGEWEPRRYGFGTLLLVIALSAAVFAVLGVLVAHIGH
jgi:hypothetical protein